MRCAPVMTGAQRSMVLGDAVMPPAALFDNRIANTNPNEKLGRFRTDRFQTA